MSQTEMSFGAAFDAEKAWRGEARDERTADRLDGMLALLAEAVEHLERKSVVYELNIAASTLSQAINEKKDDQGRILNRWAGEWIFKVLAMLTLRGDEKSAELQRKLLVAITALTPRFKIVDVDDGMTDAELAAMKRTVAREEAKRRKRAA